MYNILCCRELINAMAGTLFRDKAQLVQFIRYSHSICFPPNKSARDLLHSMSASRNSAERALEEVGMNGFCCVLSLSSVVCNDYEYCFCAGCAISVSSCSQL